MFLFVCLFVNNNLIITMLISNDYLLQKSIVSVWARADASQWR